MTKCPDEVCKHPKKDHTPRGGCMARKKHGRITCPCTRTF